MNLQDFVAAIGIIIVFRLYTMMTAEHFFCFCLLSQAMVDPTLIKTLLVKNQLQFSQELSMSLSLLIIASKQKEFSNVYINYFVFINGINIASILYHWFEIIKTYIVHYNIHYLPHFTICFMGWNVHRKRITI